MKAYTRELLRSNLLQLTRLQREHDQTGAYNELDAYFEEVKDAFGRLRSPIAAIVANVQSEIQSCLEGKELDQMKSNISSRKMRKAGISAALVVLNESMQHELAQLDAVFAEMEEKLAQTMAAASSIQPFPARTGNRETWYAEIWQQMEAGPNTKAMTLYLKTALVKADRNHLLAELLDRLMSE
jgi:hypothetical protein